MRSRSRSITPSRCASRPTRSWTSTASASRRPARRPTRSSRAPGAPAETHERQAEEDAKAKREQLMEQTRRDIETETRRAIQEIRREVADLTVMATEKVTRKTLTEEDQRRLVEDALSELDFSALASEAESETRWKRSPRSTRAPCSRSRPSRTRSTTSTISSARSPTRCHENRELTTFFFSPYFSADGEEGGPGAGRDRRQPGVRELPPGADRAPSHAGDLPDPHRVRCAVGRGAQAAAGADHQRDRAGRG